MAGATGSERPHKAPIRYCCGSPKDACKNQYHGTTSEARACTVNWLRNIRKLEQVGPREFIHENGSILVLPKHLQRAKSGKAGRAMTKGVHG